MAISVGTATSSGNKTATTSFTFNHTVASGTRTLAILITGADATDADALVAGWTFGNKEGLIFTYNRAGTTYFLAIGYLYDPPVGTFAVEVGMGGPCTDVQATVVNLSSSNQDHIRCINSSNSISTTTSHQHTMASVPANTLVLGAIVDIESAVTNLSVTSGYGTEISGSEADMGSQVVGCAYQFPPETDVDIRWTKAAAVASYATVAIFQETSRPTTTLSSPANSATGVAISSTHEFSGDNPDDGSMNFRIEIDTVNTFDSNELLQIDDYKPATPALRTAVLLFCENSTKIIAIDSQANLVRIYDKHSEAESSYSVPDNTYTYHSLTADETHVYIAASSGTTYYLYKYLIESFVQIAVKNIGTITAYTLFNKAGWIYWYTGTSFYRHNKSKFSGTPASIANASTIRGICFSADGVIYLMGTTMVSKVVNFTISTQLTVTSSNLWSNGVIYNGYLYVSDNVGNIIKVDLSTFTSYTTLALTSGKGPGVKLWLSANNNLFVHSKGSLGYDAIFHKIRLSDFSLGTVFTAYTGTVLMFSADSVDNNEIYALKYVSSNQQDTHFIKFMFDAPKFRIQSNQDPNVGFQGNNPYAANSAVTFVAPTNLDNNTTYYWRVSAVAPDEDNKFGPWSTIRSFTTVALSTWIAKTLKYYSGSEWKAKPLKVYIGGSWVEKPLKVKP